MHHFVQHGQLPQRIGAIREELWAEHEPHHAVFRRDADKGGKARAGAGARLAYGQIDRDRAAPMPGCKAPQRQRVAIGRDVDTGFVPAEAGQGGLESGNGIVECPVEHCLFLS
ncbi:hypothetical protein D9M68_881430 [compost metagenome]